MNRNDIEMRKLGVRLQRIGVRSVINFGRRPENVSIHSYQLADGNNYAQGARLWQQIQHDRKCPCIISVVVMSNYRLLREMRLYING